ncbi:DUF4102 domain-containing protein [Sphingomonas ginsenosidivorax]|uniref:DUF4102 domain-containing protein n=1 Tax=Sphingomonas ginsenosidivorax TaxID=862135 RepID=A0A5C6UGD5_9SPHN|nr:Arm DNA-binding domain-containing protein [Sphingomonas ginsenosidivorax]TXC71226.1 DUF4102 domain-containing protein [Sphingomonas ginsenosidivorax]
MLTNAAVKPVRPRAAAYKIFDERGLNLYVAPNGRKSVRMKFHFEGRGKLSTIGTWPEVSLVDAQARCEQAHELLGRGVDPSSKSAAAAAVQGKPSQRQLQPPGLLLWLRQSLAAARSAETERRALPTQRCIDT